MKSVLEFLRDLWTWLQQPLGPGFNWHIRGPGPYVYPLTSASGYRQELQRRVIRVVVAEGLALDRVEVQTVPVGQVQVMVCIKKDDRDVYFTTAPADLEEGLIESVVPRIRDKVREFA